DRELRAALREGLRSGEADPVGRAGDDDPLAIDAPSGHVFAPAGVRPVRLAVTMRARDRRMSSTRIPQNSKPYRCDATCASIDTIDAACAVGSTSRGWWPSRFASPTTSCNATLPRLRSRVRRFWT